MKKQNLLNLFSKRTFAFKCIAGLFLSFLSINNGLGQIVNLPCQTEDVAVEDLERKDFEFPSGSTAIHSEGSMHNFTLPTATDYGPCKVISNISISIDAIGVDLTNLPADCVPTPTPYYYNIALGCPDFTPASCDTDNLLGEPNTPNFTNQNLSYNGTFDLGENLSIDIVPVMNIGCTNGQSALTSNSVVLDYEICVTVTIIDATPTDVVDLGSDLDICPGTTTMVDAGIFNEYDWFPGGQTSQMITVGMGTYNVTVTDNAGCTSTDEIIINDFPDSPITFNPANPSGCDGAAVQVSVLESTYSAYNWSNSQSGQTVNLLPSATPYTVTITDSNNCTFESSVTVGNETTPNAGNDNFIIVCNDGSLTNMDIQLGTHDSGGTWNDDDGSGVDVNLNPLAVDFSTLTPSMYEFTYTVLGNAPCLPDDATITVQVLGASEAGDNNFTAECEGTQIDLTLLLSSDATSGGSFSDDNGTNQLAGNIFSTNGLAGGSYDFTYTVGSAPCVPDNAIITIQVVGAVEGGDNNVITVCEGAQVDLNTLLSSDATNGGVYSDDDFTSQLVGSIFNTTGLSGDSYDFTYSVGTGGGCGSDMAFFTVIVESSVTSGTDIDEDVCAGEMIDLFDLLTGEDTGGTFSDITGNGGLTNNMLNTTGLPTGINQYQYLVGDGISCPKDSSLISINVVAAPNISIAMDSIEICADNCETITYNLSGTAPYSFSPSIFSQNGTFIGGGVNNTSNNTFTITACNQSDTESYSNDTLNLLLDSIYTITIPSIQDENCTNNFGGIQDTLYLRAIDYARFELDTFACATDTLDINGTEFFVGNDTYLDTIPGNRCDSIISITVDFLPSADSILMVPLCAGQSTTINGTLYNDSNLNGTDTLFNMSASGCDSIVTVQVTLTTAITIDRNDTLCMDESIIIAGQTFDFDNQIDQIILSGSGCDTTINVALNFYNIEEGSIVGPFCPDYSVTVNGNVYDFNNRIGIDTLENASINGCDSIVNTNLMFFPPTDSLLMVPLCAGQSTTINGTLYNDANQSGIDTLFNGSSNGCDSIVTVQIIPSANINIERNDTLCMDESIIIGGQTFDFSNQSDIVIISGTGCDTIVDVDLNFYIVEEGDLTGPFCSDYSTMINGNTYNFNNPNGIEPFPNGSQSGCDSLLNINLIFYPLATSVQIVPLCIGSDTIINGTLYNDINPTGTDTLFNQSASGCDSLVTTTISFNPCQFNVVLIPTDDLCADGTLGSIQVETNSPVGESYTIRLTDENGNEELIPSQLGPNISGTFNTLTPGNYTIEILDSAGTVVYSNAITISSSNTPLTDGTWNVTSQVACVGGMGSIMYTASGGQTPYMYNWDDTNIGNTPSANGILAGTYNLTVTDNQGCTITSSFMLEDGVDQEPTLDIVPPSCGSATDGSIQIMNLDSQFGPYTIIVNDELVNSELLVGLTDTVYDIVIIDDNLCVIEITENLEAANQMEFAQYAIEYTITEGDSVLFVGTLEPGNFTYEWADDVALNCTDCPFPIVSPIETTIFSLQIFDESGCSQSVFVTVFVEEMEEEEEEEEEEIVIQIANIFSPNYDGLNDVVEFNFGDDKTLNIEIYDRWGNRVLQAESIDGIIIWDGIYNGTVLGSGVYVYNLQIVDIEGNTERKLGDIMLMR